MLSGQNDGIDALDFVAVVFDRNLRLSVGTEIFETPVFANLRKFHTYLVCKHMRQRHQFFRFVARKTEHHSLVARAELVEGISTLLVLHAVIYAEGNIAALLVYTRQHRARVAVKTVFCTRITNLFYRLANNGRNVDVTVGADFSRHQYAAGKTHGFARNARVLVLGY